MFHINTYDVDRPTQSSSEKETILFHGRCENCGFTSVVTPAAFGALILDAPSQDVNADPGDPRLVFLLDACTEATIRRNGYTSLSAGLRGRYLAIHDFFCSKCGTLYRTRALSLTPAIFYQIWIATAIPSFIAFYLIAPNVFFGILIGIFGGCFITAGAFAACVDVAIGIYLRLRYPSRTREFSAKGHCPECRSWWRVYPGCIRAAFPCPCCKSRSQRCEKLQADPDVYRSLFVSQPRDGS